MTDRDFLLAVLKDGREHDHSEILRMSFAERGVGMTIHSRAADLRRDGHNIVCRLDGSSGRQVSSYQLIGALPQRPEEHPTESPSSLSSSGRSESAVDEQLAIDVPAPREKWAA